jgi:hypothetical protein
MRLFIPHHSLAAYGETTLVIATGAFFGLLCVILFIVQAIVKLIALPAIFSVGVGVLVFDLVKRKLSCQEASL